MVQHGEKMIGHLSRMYRLLRRVPNGTTPMLAVLEAHVTQAGGVEIASIVRRSYCYLWWRLLLRWCVLCVRHGSCVCSVIVCVVHRLFNDL